MKDLSPQECFNDAKKSGLKVYSEMISSGRSGYLPCLEDVIKGTEIVSYVNLGLMEIPLKKLGGTYSRLRSLSFAENFMPIAEGGSEFESKWVSLCGSHLREGIRDPIKVYEYLNRYYVVEGNKRASVLKYFGAYSIDANVTRMIPKLDNNRPEILIYYEFLKFNNATKINSIWFSKKKSFGRLMELLDKFNPPLKDAEDKYAYFKKYIYDTFRSVYYELGGDRLPITTGDAFLEYAKIYGIPDEFDVDELKKVLRALIKELEIIKNDELVSIQTHPEDMPQGGVLSTLTTMIIPPKKLKVAFAYARTTGTSGWTYSHDLGRQYLEKVLGGQISTSYIDNVPEDGHAYEQIKALAENGNDVVFTTSPVFKNATLRCALEHPEVKFFNCSEYHPYRHLSNYYGRTYEARFLTGIIAGAMTNTDILGYAATSPTAEVISCINAFALGAKMVNPRAKVKVSWTMEWNSHIKFTDADKKLMEYGADIISNRNLSMPRDVTEKYGIFSMLCSMDITTKKPVHHLAAPIWRWGIFYEKIVRDILNNTYKTLIDLFSSNEEKLVNFWWGLASGVLDIYYSPKYVPPDTAKLVKLMRDMIISNSYHPFSGPIYDNKGRLRIKEDETASHEEILNMNWYVDNVEAEDYPGFNG